MSMTRQEFIDDVTTWWELIDFCNDEGCDICEYVYSSDVYDDIINEDLQERVNHESWQSIYDWLEGLPTGYDYYDTYDDYVGLDDNWDFDRYKEDVLEWADNDGAIWDEEPEEEEEGEELDDEFDEEDEEELEEINYNEFFDEDFEKTQSSYVRIEIEVSVPEKPAEPEPEPEPEFGSIEELLKPAF